jgi:ABC-type nitrate/sulfonate/bicarbonate transport system ATPase subunit
MQLDYLISSKADLKLNSISKSFWRDGKRLPVLDQLSITLESGELVALIGPSGCGKTTLLHLLAGLATPDSGEIVFDGALTHSIQDQISYMQQKDSLLPWRSALGNTLLFAEIKGEDRTKAAEDARQLFREFGLAGFENVYPAELSGGMRQRISLIRTLLCKRPILLLDEPFGALDALTRRQQQEWFLQAWKNFRFGALFVTHDVDEALILANRIYVLSERPARVMREIRIELPRPRPPTDEKFVRLKAEILAELDPSRFRDSNQGGTAHVP